MTETIHTRRLTLRPIAPDDAPQITALIGDYDVARWLTLVPHPYALSDAQTFISNIRNLGQHWAIVADASLIGVVSIRSELGYWLGKPYWGRGYMTEAASAVVSDHFDETSAPLNSGFHLGNAASAQVLRKLGFVAGGTRTAFSSASKEEVTIQEMTLTRADWQARP
ncbi:GNAT family N-acetyltransferase [Sulfitobacter aestuariivivens]|uniref:GNAT family N-acetyltransferase n=1 Tax=Sulfitobacter aestuariivivens TaxID=2766981 RepID=A0A927HEC2_9RHOB|nr:GNAT family N-acetyltransferase [Sulfitobacter aestuariivivens]MBD3663233.1 GNAT family N-acetyltransferase [Sulfitobacter aestuariivivens]